MIKDMVEGMNGLQMEILTRVNTIKERPRVLVYLNGRMGKSMTESG